MTVINVNDENDHFTVKSNETVTISESTEITPAFAPVETFDNGLGSYVYNISSASRVNVQNGELVMSTDNGAQDSEPPIQKIQSERIEKFE